jgi:hypothetical protein
MNIAWPLLLGALALGGYGQALRLGASPLSAAIVSYLLVSAPILDAHAALAGYADLPLAVVFGLAAIAFFAWAITNDTRQLVLSIAFASMAPLFKIPGVIWSLMLVPGILVAFFPEKQRRQSVALGRRRCRRGTGRGGLSLCQAAEFRADAISAHVEPNAASGFVFDNYFLLDNYHLLWYFVVAALVVWWRHALSSTLRPATAFVAACVAFLAVSFFFTNSAEWWGITVRSTVQPSISSRLWFSISF